MYIVSEEKNSHRVSEAETHSSNVNTSEGKSLCLYKSNRKTGIKMSIALQVKQSAHGAI